MAEWASLLAVILGLLALVSIAGAIELAREAERPKTGGDRPVAVLSGAGLAAFAGFFGLMLYLLAAQLLRAIGA